MAAVIGVTGGFGSGKSSVCALLGEWGAPVFSADEEARRIGDEEFAVRSEIARAFGEQVYRSADGKLDREYVAGIVFSDPSKLKILNSIIHPRVFVSVDQFRNRESAGAHPYVLVESALLFESGLDKKMDYVLAVETSLDQRIERVRKKSGLSATAIKQRIAAQLPQEGVVKRADFIVHNDGTVADLRTRLQFLHSVFTLLPERHRKTNDAD